MQAAADFRQERNELETILASGILNRAPNLAQLLTYVCAKYFEGAGEQIKEYNIAVEALGRPADFDQKRDSIVRVEAHRLRKRLREYYISDGAGHQVRIEIPSGQNAVSTASNPTSATLCKVPAISSFTWSRTVYNCSPILAGSAEIIPAFKFCHGSTDAPNTVNPAKCKNSLRAICDAGV